MHVLKVNKHYIKREFHFIGLFVFIYVIIPINKRL